MIKRLIDILISILLLIILFPFLILISLLNLILEGRPVFYISKRFVKEDISISVYKFRSMIKDATNPKYKLNERYLKNGFLNIPLTKELYTPFGIFLERYQIVEILQLFNILFNDMSLIGNRPLPILNVEQIKKFKGWEKRFQSPAGISGIAQITNSNEITSLERLELEGLYSEVFLKGKILKCDMYIIFYTIRLILFKKSITFSKAKLLLKSFLVS